MDSNRALRTTAATVITAAVVTGTAAVAEAEADTESMRPGLHADARLGVQAGFPPLAPVTVRRWGHRSTWPPSVPRTGIPTVTPDLTPAVPSGVTTDVTTDVTSAGRAERRRTADVLVARGRTARTVAVHRRTWTPAARPARRVVHLRRWSPAVQPTVKLRGPAHPNKAIAFRLVAQRAWSPTQFRCLDSLWTRESNWNHRATNPSSGAYGIPQALPGTKMSGAGGDWRWNPATQIRWGLSYIKIRYGSPCGAWGHFRSNNWY